MDTHLDPNPNSKQENPARQPELSKTQENFAMLLHNALGTEWFNDHLAKHNGTAIVSIGCGSGEEFRPLKKLSPDAYIRGVDINLDIISPLQELLEYDGYGDIDLIAADAAKSDAWNKHGDQQTYYNLIIIRNPNILSQPSAWQDIFKQARQHTKPEGRIFITTFNEDEKNLIVSALEKNELSHELHLNKLYPTNAMFHEPFCIVAQLPTTSHE